MTGRLLVDGTVPPARRIIIEKAGVNVLDESVMVGEGNALQNVFVYLRTKDVEVAPRYAATAKDQLVLDINNGRFEPHMLVLRTSQTLKITNSSAFNVNVKLMPILNTAQNPLLAPRTSVTWQLAVQENVPVPVDSNVQPWLRAWLLVRDNPYASVSGADGTFTIRDLPAGVELEFQLWQERAGYLRDVPFRGGMSKVNGRFKLTLKPGENDLGDLKVPVSLLRLTTH